MTYSQKLQDPRFQKLRLEVLNFTDFKCEDCGRKDKSLHIHHTVYVSGREPWEYELDTLMSLCPDCHKHRQGREEAMRLALGKLTRHFTVEELETEVWILLKEISLRETERYAESFS